METKDWIRFANLWNQGKTAPELAQEFGCKPSTIRNWVNMLRKKGVQLKKRGIS